MPFATHFKSPAGETLPIAASKLVTVEIPAAGSANLGDWMKPAENTTEYYNQQAGHNMPKSSAVIPHCTYPSVFTDHGLTINYEEQLQGWVLWIDSLPETACTLTLLFINHSTEGTPCVLPALGVDAPVRAVLEELAVVLGQQQEALAQQQEAHNQLVQVANDYMQSAAETTAQHDEQISQNTADLGTLEQKTDDLEHATADLGTAVKALQAKGAATYYKVRIPAAGSAELYGWHVPASGGYELLIGDVAWMTADLFLELKSENTALFTDHNLRLNQDDGFLDFTIDSLPEKESVLYVYVPNAVNGGELNGGES